MNASERLIEGKLYQVAQQESVPDRTKLTIELSHRLHDLHELDPGAAIAYLQLMVKLYRIDPWVYHITLAILAGNMNAGKSLATQAIAVEHSKQHEHQRQNRALNLLEQFLPEVAKVIREILNRQKPEEIGSETLTLEQII